MRQSEQNYEVNKIMSKDTAETDLNFFFKNQFYSEMFSKTKEILQRPRKN